jgi:hypothetical protein
VVDSPSKGLNPFLHQVISYDLLLSRFRKLSDLCLNPFLHQVISYYTNTTLFAEKDTGESQSLPASGHFLHGSLNFGSHDYISEKSQSLPASGHFLRPPCASLLFED